ncbi:MAG: DUF4124 domain-containing protein [Gammaproteobacteria bacterium]|nr:DUF4124 domain-containing protein [Gammaproteobacteria bacterium]MCP5195991.1 DUF4124 domain-containing protein [Gammaproteobacteria bacterium]
MRNDDGQKSARYCKSMSVVGAQRQFGVIPMWLLLGLGILGGVLLYWYTTPQETPSWMRDWLPGMPEYTGPLYRWRDGQGQLQVTDRPPQGRPYETIQYRSDANVIPKQGQ